jgi:hypothetical protein
MVAALLHPLAVRSGAPTPFVMRAIGGEIKAWQDGERTEEEAVLRIRMLIKADRALNSVHAPSQVPPPKPRLRRRSPT